MPGGRAPEPGFRDLPASGIASTPAVTVTPDTPLGRVADLMLDQDIGSVLVVDAEGTLVGIVSDSDFATRGAGIPFSTFRAPQLLGRWIGPGGVERIYEEARTRPVSDIMTGTVYSVDDAAGLEDVLEVMARRRVKHVPVVRDGVPVGMVARHDLLKLLADHVRPRG